MVRQGIKKRYWVLAILILLIGAYWLFANAIIKNIAEKKLSEAYGAEVNIGSLRHSLLPASVVMQDIGMTNPSAPDSDKVRIGTASADVELMPLLSDRVVVNDLQVLNVKFDQPRATPGKVYRPPSHQFSFDDIKDKARDAVPTVDELLERSALKTTRAIQEADAAYKTFSTSLKSDYQALPDKTRLDEYKADVAKLKETDYKNPQALLEAKASLDELKASIRADREKLSAFTQQASDAKKALAQTLKALKEAPGQDYDLLKGALVGDEAALGQITYMVFGDKAEEFTGYLMSAMQIVLPLIQGDDKPGEPKAEIPSILVRHADVTVDWQGESIKSAFENITNTHPLIGQPTTFTIAAAGNWLKEFTSNGQFWIDDAGVDASQQWSLAGINLKGIEFVKDKKLDAALKQAILTTTGSLSVKDNALTGSSKIDLSSLDLTATGSNDLTNAIASALSSLKSLNMTLTLDGTVQNPGFHLKSDLDNKLAQSALAQLTASQQGKLDALKAKLNGMVAGQLNDNQQGLDAVTVMLDAAKGDTAALESLLETRLNDVVEDKKKKLFDKLKGKLGNGN